MKNLRIAHILHNPFKNDSRVIKEIATLSEHTQIQKIDLFCLYYPGLPIKESISPKATVYRLTKPKFDPRLFFLKGAGFTIWMVKVIRHLRLLRPEVIHCHDLPGICVGFFYKLLISNSTIIYDSHEFQSEVANLSETRKRIIRFIEKISITAADKFITVSPSIAANYIYRYGIKKPHLVLNCPPTVKIESSNILRDIFKIPSDHLIFLYQGGLAKSRGIELMLEAFDRLNGTNRHIVFMGFGPLEELVISKSKISANIHFHPAVKHDVLLKYTASADFGICLTDLSCKNHMFCLPNKLFEYINAGVPVIATDLIEVRKIIDEYKIGFIIREETVDALICSIEAASKSSVDIRFNTSIAAKIYNWESQKPPLLSCYGLT